MFYPLVLAILLHLAVSRRLPWWAAAGHLLAVLAAFAAILHWGTLKLPPEALLHQAQARTDVAIQPQVYQVMASTLAEQRSLVRRMYTPYVVHVLWLTLALSAPYFALLARLLQQALEAAGAPPAQRLATAALFLSPLLLCTLGHDTTRWIGAMCLDATLMLFFLQLAQSHPAGSPGHPVRDVLSRWAAQPEALLWLAYLIAIGPYGATGLRSAEQLVTAWYGP